MKFLAQRTQPRCFHLCIGGKVFDSYSIDSCRLSIMFWIGPNAYFFRTKSAIRKQTIVQIISPGVTEISGLDAVITYLTSTYARIEPSRP